MRKLSESVWTDIHKKSIGIQVRKEDDINLLDNEGMYEYLKNHYTTNMYDGIEYITSAGNLHGSQINVPIFKYNGSYSYLHMHEENKTISFDLKFIDDLSNVISELSKRFLVTQSKEFSSGWTVITIEPKDGEKTTNKFFLELLDYFIEEAPNIVLNQHKTRKNEKIIMLIKKNEEVK